MDKTIKTAVSIDYIMLDRNFGKIFGKVGARPIVEDEEKTRRFIIAMDT